MCHRMESQCEVIPKSYMENMVTAIDPSGFKGLKTWERGDCRGQSSEWPVTAHLPLASQPEPRLSEEIITLLLGTLGGIPYA